MTGQLALFPGENDQWALIFFFFLCKEWGKGSNSGLIVCYLEIFPSGLLLGQLIQLIWRLLILSHSSKDQVFSKINFALPTPTSTPQNTFRVDTTCKEESRANIWYLDIGKIKNEEEGKKTRKIRSRGKGGGELSLINIILLQQ